MHGSITDIYSMRVTARHDSHHGCLSPQRFDRWLERRRTLVIGVIMLPTWSVWLMCLRGLNTSLCRATRRQQMAAEMSTWQSWTVRLVWEAVSDDAISTGGQGYTTAPYQCSSRVFPFKLVVECNQIAL